ASVASTSPAASPTSCTGPSRDDLAHRFSCRRPVPHCCFLATGTDCSCVLLDIVDPVFVTSLLPPATVRVSRVRDRSPRGVRSGGSASDERRNEVFGTVALRQQCAH